MNQADLDVSPIELAGELAVVDFSVTVEGAMRERGMSLPELARVSGISTDAIRRVLLGDSNVKLVTIAKLAHALDRALKVAFVTRA